MEGFLNPSEVLNQLDLRESMVAADFGCGSGGWIIPLARRLKDGRVYAIDILEEPLSALRSKAEHEGISNIELIRSNIESSKGSKVPDNCCDVVLMTNLLFQAEDRKGVIAEAKRVLKQGGKILVIDWKKKSPLGPKQGRVLPEEIKNLAKELNLKPEREFEAGTFHWGLILVKPRT